MPPREPKARLLTREYVADREFMTAFSPAEREWYLLTALFADDAGYLDWDPDDNAAALYRFEAPRTRLARVGRMVVKFTDQGRFKVLRCKRHALMPRVAKRPRSGGREYAIRDAHVVECQSTSSQLQSTTSQLQSTAVDSQSTSVLSSPVLTSPVQTNTSLDSQHARAPAKGRGGASSDFKDRMAAAGVDPDKLKGKS